MASIHNIIRAGLEKAGTPEKLAQAIDSTLLSPTATIGDAENLVLETAEFGFNCAVLTPLMAQAVSRTAERLGVRLCAVVGFPLGHSPLESKLAEARMVLESGAQEIDLVPALGLGPSRVEEETAGIVDVAKSYGAYVKVIVEAPLWEDDVLEALVVAARRGGANMVKTSTGVYTKGGDPATVRRLWRFANREGLEVKASGGIRTAFDAILALGSGASRIGTSSARKIIEGLEGW